MHIQIAIIGAGTAGINVAAQLARKIPADSIRIFDSSNMHYYQSAWTMAAAGFYDFNRTFKPMAQVLPVHQIQNAVTEIIPS
jgi:sulfide:quinone oxidoreductase